MLEIVALGLESIEALVLDLPAGATAIGELGHIGLIDRLGPNGSAWAVVQGSKLAARFQSGYLYSYALVMLLGLTAAISWVVVK